MKFQVSEGDKFQKIMEAEISVEEMEQPIRFACKRLAEKVNIPGFRKGKAPRSILENYLGINAILEEAADDIMPRAYVDGLKETGLEPVCQPEIEMINLTEGEPMRFKAVITVKPQLKLGQYKGLPITRRIIDVNDKAVDDEIEKQRQRMTKLVDATEDTAASTGDTVVIDFKGTKDGVAFDGGTANDYPLELGSGNFIPGFEDQLIGAKMGEEKNVAVTFPEEYAVPDLAGQPVVFEVKIKGIKTKILPELDADFVKEVSETAENLDDLRTEIRAKLSEESLQTAINTAHNDVIMKAVENCEVEMPPVMVEQQIDSLVAENTKQMTNRGISMDQFLEYLGLTAEQFREQSRDQATFMVKRELLLEAVIKAENIEVSDQEVEAQIQEISTKYWMTLEQVKEELMQGDRIEDLKYDIKRKKAVDLIYENAEITDEHADSEDMAKMTAKNAAAAAESADTDQNDKKAEAEETPVEAAAKAEK